VLVVCNLRAICVLVVCLSCACRVLIVRLALQSSKAAELQELRDAAIEQNREDKRLVFAAKLENAERTRRVKQERRRAMQESLALTDARLQHAKVLGEGISAGFMCQAQTGSLRAVPLALLPVPVL
jgi:hypothetical protein